MISPSGPYWIWTQHFGTMKPHLTPSPKHPQKTADLIRSFWKVFPLLNQPSSWKKTNKVVVVVVLGLLRAPKWSTSTLKIGFIVGQRPIPRCLYPYTTFYSSLLVSLLKLNEFDHLLERTSPWDFLIITSHLIHPKNNKPRWRSLRRGFHDSTHHHFSQMVG